MFQIKKISAVFSILLVVTFGFILSFNLYNSCQIHVAKYLYHYKVENKNTGDDITLFFEEDDEISSINLSKIFQVICNPVFLILLFLWFYNIIFTESRLKSYFGNKLYLRFLCLRN